MLLLLIQASEEYLSKSSFQDALSSYFIKSYAYCDHIQRLQALNYSLRCTEYMRLRFYTQESFFISRTVTKILK
jgi:hypothetical protein